MAGELSEYDALVRRMISTARTIPSRAATVAVNFTKARFRAQNWLDQTAEPWEKRKRKKRETRADKRNVLVKSGRLLRSIRKLSANSDRAIIGTDVPYAQVHNDGGDVKATYNVSSHQVRSHRRAAHTRERGGRTESVKSQTVAAHNVRAHRRTVNFKMPQRQFLGNSSTMNRDIERMMTTEFNKAITKP